MVLGALLFGYDATYFSGVQAMSTFLDVFGNATDANGSRTLTDTLRSLLSSMIMVGEMVGCLMSASIGNRVGRRQGITIAMVVVCIGAAMQACSTNLTVFIVGRTVLGIGIGIVSNVVPLYLSEITPKEIRGAMVGSWQFNIDFGKVVGACVDEGTKGINSSASWRIPILFMLLVPVILFSVMWYLPESPRWLMRMDKPEAAAKALIKIRKEDKEYDPSHDIAEMIDDIARDNVEGGWIDMIMDPIERRKLYCTVGMLVGSQITGIYFISSYGTVFVELVGLENAFEISIIIYVVEVVGAFIALFLVDRYGRRLLLLPSVFFMALTMFIVGTLDIKQPRSKGADYGILIMIMLFAFAFCIASGPLGWVVAAEFCVGRNRNRIMTLGTFGFWIMAWLVTFAMPYMYTAMGPKLCYVYCVTSASYFLFIYFSIGDTVGKSMEEISLLLNRRVPSKQWKDYQFNDEYSSGDAKEEIFVTQHEETA